MTGRGGRVKQHCQADKSLVTGNPGSLPCLLAMQAPTAHSTLTHLRLLSCQTESQLYASFTGGGPEQKTTGKNYGILACFYTSVRASAGRLEVEELLPRQQQWNPEVTTFPLTILKTLEKFLKGTVAEDERQWVLSEGERKILASQQLSVLIKKKSINNVAVFSTASSCSGSQ